MLPAPEDSSTPPPTTNNTTTTPNTITTYQTIGKTSIIPGAPGEKTIHPKPTGTNGASGGMGIELWSLVCLRTPTSNGDPEWSDSIFGYVIPLAVIASRPRTNVLLIRGYCSTRNKFRVRSGAHDHRPLHSSVCDVDLLHPFWVIRKLAC